MGWERIALPRKSSLSDSHSPSASAEARRRHRNATRRRSAGTCLRRDLSRSSHAPARRRRPSAHSRTAPAARFVVSALERLVVQNRLLQLRALEQYARELCLEQLLRRAFSRLLRLSPRHGVLRGRPVENALLRQAARAPILDTVDPCPRRRVRDVVLELRPADVLTHARAGRRFVPTTHVERVVAVQIVEKVVHADAGHLERGSELRERLTAHDDLLERRLVSTVVS